MTYLGMAAGLPTPELLDADIDSAHRSYLSAVEHRRLRTFQCRPPAEYLYLDNRWLGRYFIFCCTYFSSFLFAILTDSSVVFVFQVAQCGPPYFGSSS